MSDQIVVRNVHYPPFEPAEPVSPRAPQHGARSPLSLWPQVVARTRGEVVAGFRAQEVRMRLAGRLVAFTASLQPDPFPFAHPVLLLSTSIHDYAGIDPGVAHLPAVALAHDRQWLDTLCVVRDDRDGWTAARRLPGRFLVRWSQDGMELVDLADLQVIDRWQMRGRMITHRCCPLIPGALPGDECKLHGGPWVSMARVAARQWFDRRDLYLAELGCDESCERGSARSHRRIPTRYDTWLGQQDFAQPEFHQEGRCDICQQASGHSASVAVVDPGPGGATVRCADGRTWQQGLDEPIVLSRGRIFEVGDTTVAEALSRMVVDPAGGSEQVLDWQDGPTPWRAMDADLNARFRGLDFVHRWAAIGRMRVTGVRLGHEVWPLAIDLRGPGLVLPSVLVRFGACQMGVANGWLLSQVRMLHGGSAAVVSRDTGDVTAVAGWLQREGFAHLAAMFIEPLDPAGDLTLLERQRYYDAVIGVLGDARLGVAADDLRAGLHDAPGYLRARDAMADPRSDEEFWTNVQWHAQRLGTREVFRPVV